jgi:hypothetical protein
MDANEPAGSSLASLWRKWNNVLFSLIVDSQFDRVSPDATKALHDALSELQSLVSAPEWQGLRQELYAWLGCFQFRVAEREKRPELRQQAAENFERGFVSEPVPSGDFIVAARDLDSYYGDVAGQIARSKGYKASAAYLEEKVRIESRLGQPLPWTYLALMSSWNNVHATAKDENSPKNWHEYITRSLYWGDKLLVLETSPWPEKNLKLFQEDAAKLKAKIFQNKTSMLNK